MKNKDKLNFRLKNVRLEQFAINEDYIPDSDELKLLVNTKFSADLEKRIIKVFSSFLFSSKSKIIITIEGSCSFEINDEDWRKIFNEQEKKVNLTQSFASHLAFITVGTTRGILYCKTQNTPLCNFFIPLINLSEIITTDIIL